MFTFGNNNFLNSKQSDCDMTGKRYIKTYNRLILALNILLFIKNYILIVCLFMFGHHGALEIVDLASIFSLLIFGMVSNIFVIYLSIHQMLDFYGFELLMLLFDIFLFFTLEDMAQYR